MHVFVVMVIEICTSSRDNEPKERVGVEAVDLCVAAQSEIAGYHTSHCTLGARNSTLKIVTLNAHPQQWTVAVVGDLFFFLHLFTLTVTNTDDISMVLQRTVMLCEIPTAWWFDITSHGTYGTVANYTPCVR